MNSRDGNVPAVGERRLMGTLREALAAAAAPSRPAAVATPPPLPALETKVDVPSSAMKDALIPAAEAAREARGVTRPEAAMADLDVPQTKVVRAARTGERTAGSRTQLIRGKLSVKRAEFFQDPVVGWLVVVGGLGLGAFRPIFEGNNTIGRGKSQRIPIDFGDETISSEEQAYLRYDSVDRKYLLVPNLSKTNIVAVNDRKPTGATELAAMDLITMGRTQLVFVPFCGTDFDWAELQEMKD